MSSNIFLQALVWVSLLGGSSLAMPSSNDGLDLNDLLPLNGMLSPRSEPLEIRGVYGGRKKRYIVERAAPTCCSSNIKCKATIGEYLDNSCNCTKCASGKFPTADGRSCTDRCPDGGSPNGKGGCCKGNTCEQDDKNRQGKCPNGQVLDPREGGQTPETSNPKCMIDDSKKCPNGRIPATRSEGDELREDYEPECGKPEEETKKCPKGRFPEVRIYTGVSPDATTRTECERTRQFDKIKEKKIKDKDFRKREKKEWNKNEPERREEKEKFRRAWEKIKKAREEFKKKFQETHKKLTEMNDRKKARMGKCAPIAAMMYAFTESLSNQRKREEEESPYDWTTDYFDEPFVDSSVFLSYWPDDIDIDDVKEVTDEGVNADEWMEAWEEMVSGRELRQNGPGCVKRSTDLNRRCPARRSEDGDDYFDNLDDEDLNDDNFRDLDDVHVLTGNDTVLERYVAAEEEIKPPPRDLMIRDPNYYVKRNPVAIFVEILAFVLRLGLSLVARTAGRISRYSPRLANIMNRNPDRLFKIAGRGKGTSRGVEGMKNAMSNIVRHPSFRQCILEGVP